MPQNNPVSLKIALAEWQLKKNIEQTSSIDKYIIKLFIYTLFMVRIFILYVLFEPAQLKIYSCCWNSFLIQYMYTYIDCVHIIANIHKNYVSVKLYRLLVLFCRPFRHPEISPFTDSALARICSIQLLLLLMVLSLIK